MLNELFLSKNGVWKGNLYLVGDPKQSIYSFRQADIYTYLAAAKAMGEHNCYSLSVNYRATYPLVQALNHLFAAENLPSFIPLPKHQCDLTCTTGQAAKRRRSLRSSAMVRSIFLSPIVAHSKNQRLIY